MRTGHPTSMCLPILAVLAFAVAPGCAVDTADAAAAAAAAQTRNPAYDAVLEGTPTVETVSTPGGAASAETRLVGYVADAKAADVADKLVAVGRWTEIRWEDGSPAFSSARVNDDDVAGSKRTIAATVEMPDAGELDVSVVSQEQGRGYRVTITNTSAVTALFTTVLAPGKLVIDAKVVPYERGVIVDAKARVKLDAFESRAPGLTGSLAPIFTWVKGR